MEVILSGMSNETLTVNTELKPISSSADRLLGATVGFKRQAESLQGQRGQGTVCVYGCVCLCVYLSKFPFFIKILHTPALKVTCHLPSECLAVFVML